MAAKGTIIIVKKKRGGGHGGHHGGAWKVAYADFVTAMMAFFMVMWLMGTDEATRAEVAGHFNGTIESESTPLTVAPDPPKGGSKFDAFVEPVRLGGQPMDLPAGRVAATKVRENDLLAMEDELVNSISMQLGMTSESSVRLETHFDNNGLVLRIVAADFFAHRESQMQRDMAPLINRIGVMLTHYKKHLIRVEGHTEPTEQSEQDPSESWRLSAARAQSVIQYWLQRNSELDPGRFQIAGASYFHPIADNATEVGRAVNRRVEILVLQTSLGSQAD